MEIVSAGRIARPTRPGVIVSLKKRVALGVGSIVRQHHTEIQITAAIETLLKAEIHRPHHRRSGLPHHRNFKPISAGSQIVHW